jgi:hypothetical protein
MLLAETEVSNNFYYFRQRTVFSRLPFESHTLPLMRSGLYPVANLAQTPFSLAIGKIA